MEYWEYKVYKEKQKPRVALRALIARGRSRARIRKIKEAKAEAAAPSEGRDETQA
jgi:hypothetical protein